MSVTPPDARERNMHNALLRIEIDVVSHPRTSASSGKKQNLVLEIAENRGKIAFAIVFASRTFTRGPRAAVLFHVQRICRPL